MPALRQRLKRPETYLAVALALFALAAFDAARPSASQVTARMYVRLVEMYQQHGRALSSRIFQCRFRPTCSEYSRQAVSKHGIAGGLRLTWTRLASCRGQVPLGTPDPVP